MKMTDGLFHKVFDEIGTRISGHREGALDRGHRRGQARRHARGLRRHRDAEPLRRHPLGRRGADRGLRRPRGLGQHRRRTAPCSRRSTARRRAAPARTSPTRRGCCSARVMMLVHIEQPDVAERVHNAWLTTIEDGVHTYDIYEGRREPPEGRHEGIRRGRRRAPREGSPGRSRPSATAAGGRGDPPAAPPPPAPPAPSRRPSAWTSTSAGRARTPTPSPRGSRRSPAPEFELTLLTSRGIKVWPDGQPETSRADECRCRFVGADGGDRSTQADDRQRCSRASRTPGSVFVKTERL